MLSPSFHALSSIFPLPAASAVPGVRSTPKLQPGPPRVPPGRCCGLWHHLLIHHPPGPCPSPPWPHLVSPSQLPGGPRPTCSPAPRLPLPLAAVQPFPAPGSCSVSFLLPSAHVWACSGAPRWWLVVAAGATFWVFVCSRGTVFSRPHVPRARSLFTPWITCSSEGLNFEPLDFPPPGFSPTAWSCSAPGGEPGGRASPGALG